MSEQRSAAERGPGTASGRALLRPHIAAGLPHGGLLRAILAIEAEARAPWVEVLRALVAHHVDSTGCGGNYCPPIIEVRALLATLEATE